MSPEVAERLGHVLESIAAIEEFVADISFEEYSGSRIHRRAVERELGVVGGSLSIASRLHPSLATSIPELRDSVRLRDRVIRDYETVDDSIIWVAIHEDLPALREQVLALLG